MSGRKVYFDTSALAKWYINEARSQDVEDYIQCEAPVTISSLTEVEMRCLLARRRREGSFDAKMEGRLYAAFREDIGRGFLLNVPLRDSAATAAISLVAMLPDIPLRTLDAMHLAIARETGADVVATADRMMAAAADALDMQVATFW